MDNQIDPGDNFFGINLSDCALTNPQGTQKAMDALRADTVSVVGPTPASGVAYCMVCGGPAPCPTHARATGVMTPILIMDSTVGLKAANAHLTRQLAAQAVAHAEQMEELRASMPKKSGSQLYAEMMGQAVDQCELTNLHRELAAARAFIEQLKAAELSAMRVTPATQPTDAQQTASDVKAAQERRPDGTLKPVARAWEAPKRLTDVRRIGG